MLRLPRRQRFLLGRARTMPPRLKPRPPFSPARGSPASILSCAKPRPGSAPSASVSRSGWAEDETALRDAFHLTRPGADPGPVGRRLLAWRALTANSAGQLRVSIARAAEALDVPRDEMLQAAMDGRPRWIEVKSTSGVDGRFDWPRKEFEKALRERDRYELWRVYRVTDRAPVAKCFRNPARMLGARQITLELGMLRANIEGLG